MFGWFKKFKKEGKNMTTAEEIKEAEKDIEKSGEDSQSEKDRVDESVAEQELKSGTEDTQSAKDRVDESKGEQKAEKTNDEVSKKLDEVLAAIKSLTEKISVSSVDESGEERKLDEAAEKYGVDPEPMPLGSKNEEFDDEKVNALLRMAK